MEQQTYEITAPNGKVLSITGDHVPSEAELHDIFAKAGVETGAKPPKPDPHQPHISASMPGPLAFPADASAPRVTYDDMVRDPVGSIKTIGQIVKRDVSDPKLWLGLALSYFGPKVFNTVGPVVARAAAKTAAVAGEVATPGMAKDLGISVLGNERVSAGLRIADRVRNAVKTASAPAADAPMPPAPTSPVETAPASTAAQSVDTPPAPPATKFPLQKALNELAIQARRQGVKLSETESQAGATLMRDQGASAEDVVKTLAASRSPSGLTLSADEQQQAATLRSAGKSGAEVEAAILKARQLAKKLKTPATGAVEDAVQRRNQTGRWED